MDDNNVPTIEPTDLVAGDTWKWLRSLSHKASAGWVLKYTLINATSKITIVATASGDDHLVSVPAATTAPYVAGTYTWQAYVEKAAERYSQGSGTVKVHPNFAAATTFDGRSHARRTLDAIEAVLEKRATREDQSYSIGGRTLARIPNADLLALRDRYRSEVARENDADRIANGLAPRNRIFARF